MTQPESSQLPQLVQAWTLRAEKSAVKRQRWRGSYANGNNWEAGVDRHPKFFPVCRSAVRPAGLEFTVVPSWLPWLANRLVGITDHGPMVWRPYVPGKIYNDPVTVQAQGGGA